jgi:hypothetical protein
VRPSPSGQDAEAPIVAHAFPAEHDQPLSMRRISSVIELRQVLGEDAVTKLRDMLFSSELLSVLVGNTELLNKRNVLTNLSCLATSLEMGNKREGVEVGILKSGMKSLASELMAECLEQARYYSQDKMNKAMGRFAEAAEATAGLPSILNLGAIAGMQSAALTAELLKDPPQLKVTSSSRLQDQAAAKATKAAAKAAAETERAAEAKKAAEAAKGKGPGKRNKAQAAVGGGTPDGKKKSRPRGTRGG